MPSLISTDQYLSPFFSEKNLIDKAIIVAAGISSRLYPITSEKPKALLKVSGKEILKRSIDILRKNGINDIAIVVGYKKDMIIESFEEDIFYITNPFYKISNNLASFWLAKSFAGNSPFVYLHSDIIYHENIISSTLQQFKDNNNNIELVVDFGSTDKEAMKVIVTEENYLIKSDKKISLDKAGGEWTGIAYVKQPEYLFKYVEKVLFEDGLTNYDSFAFTKMAEEGNKIYCSSTNNFPWIEVDFMEDLEKAKEMFK